MDKLNGIRFNFGKVNNDLQDKGSSQPVEEQPVEEAEQQVVKSDPIDPDKLMDAMKKQGLHNLNLVMASGNVANTSIQEMMDKFSQTITPQMHEALTAKVKQTCEQEFAGLNVPPDVISDVVDNIIFNSLTA